MTKEFFYSVLAKYYFQCNNRIEAYNYLVESNKLYLDHTYDSRINFLKSKNDILKALISTSNENSIAILKNVESKLGDIYDFNRFIVLND